MICPSVVLPLWCFGSSGVRAPGPGFGDGLGEGVGGFAAAGGAAALFAGELHELDGARTGRGDEGLQLVEKAQAAEDCDEREQGAAVTGFEIGDRLAREPGSGGKLGLAQILIEPVSLQACAEIMLPSLVAFREGIHSE